MHMCAERSGCTDDQLRKASRLQRKVLTPNDVASLAGLLAFQLHYESLARPFEWTFNRQTGPTTRQTRGSPLAGRRRVTAGDTCTNS